MVDDEKRPLRVFLCHASGDKPPVRNLYKRLTIEGVDAWLDKEKLLPGQDWRLEIPRAVKEADVVVVCLSNKSVTKEGYVQKEIKFALDSAEEKPEGAIFLIPARLEDCVVPERLGRWQWVDLYEEDGFTQLLRSLKLRAYAVGATVEPSSYGDSDKETERRLDQLYTEGLAAFYTEDWDRACHRFQSILSEQPNNKAAAEKLAEAERQRNLAKLYEQAEDAIRAENWQNTIKVLEEIAQKSAGYKDVAQLLGNAKKQKQLNELYAEAGKLHAAQKWQAVVRVFEQISALEPNFLDVNGILSIAQKEVAEIKRIEGLNSLYSQGVRAMDGGQWYEARKLLERVHKSQTGFLETEHLLKKVEGEIVKVEENNKRSEQVNVLYEQAHGLLRSKKWRNAMDKMTEIQKLDDLFFDKDEIARKASSELEREEQEAQRQNQLAALYAETVKLLRDEKYQNALDKWQEVKILDPKYPDRQWVQRTARKKLAGKPIIKSVKLQNFSQKQIFFGGGIIALVLITMIIMSVVKKEENAVPPTSTPTILFEMPTRIIPSPTNSPTVVVPTVTVSIPTATMDADPSVYDNFNNSAFDQKINSGRWSVVRSDPNGSAYQEQGRLVLIQSGKNRSQDLKANSLISTVTYVEVQFELDKSTALGGIVINVGGDSSNVFCQLALFNPGSPSKFCHFSDFNKKKNKDFAGSSASYNREYVFGIEIDRSKRIIVFYIDGKKAASYDLLPDESIALNTISIQIWAETDGTIKGYADNIKINP